VANPFALTTTSTELGQPHGRLGWERPTAIWEVKKGAGPFSFGDLSVVTVHRAVPAVILSRFREPEPQSKDRLLEVMARQLLAHDQVPAARKLLQALPSAMESGSIRRLRVLLSEPRLQRKSAPRPGASADLSWITQNAAKFRGRWVAVAEGALVDSDVSLEALLARIRRSSAAVQPLLHRL
jgi:hypothetical protein